MGVGGGVTAASQRKGYGEKAKWEKSENWGTTEVCELKKKRSERNKEKSKCKLTKKRRDKKSKVKKTRKKGEYWGGIMWDVN